MMDSRNVSNAIAKIISKVDDECRPEKLSKQEYAEVLDGVISRLESMEDCVKSELENGEEP